MLPVMRSSAALASLHGLRHASHSSICVRTVVLGGGFSSRVRLMPNVANVHLVHLSTSTDGSKASEHSTEDGTLLYRSRSWQPRALGAAAVLKGLFWSTLGYFQWKYPDLIDVYWVWYGAGAAMTALIASSAASMAANTVKDMTLAGGGTTVLLKTHRVFGGTRDPVEVPIKDIHRGVDLTRQYRIRIDNAKVYLLLDKNAEIPNAALFQKILDGQSVSLEKVKQQWRAAVDPNSGKTYWYNPVTRQSVWKKPDNAA